MEMLGGLHVRAAVSRRTSAGLHLAAIKELAFDIERHLFGNGVTKQLDIFSHWIHRSVSCDAEQSKRTIKVETVHRFQTMNRIHREEFPGGFR